MKRTLSLALCLILVVSFAGLAWAKDSTGRAVARDYSDYHFTADGAQSVLTSSSSGVRFKSTTGADTFCLYGGPGSQNGKFDNGNGVTPDVLGHSPHAIIAGEWYGVDLTDQPVFWQVASSNGVDNSCFANLDGNGSSGGAGDGPGNEAWWAGQTAAQKPGWANAPGYGNNWNAALQWSQAIANPGTTAQTVGLTFAFNHDTEPGYDFFNVEYDSSTTVKVVYSTDGDNAPFAAPGVQYPTGGAQAITFDAGAYAGLNNDEIVIRLTLTSDGAWSDEDGLWPTTCGGAVVDDITVTYNDGNKAVVVDFSDVDNTNSWGNVKSPFAGDFSRIWPRMTDIDPCRENFTPVGAFFDDGACPKNQDNNGGNNPCASTGGSQSNNWTYGVTGGWVTNYTGGLTFGLVDLANELWSPEIIWDLPGTFDDTDPEIAGSFIRFSVWRHLPLLNGIFYIWNVTASDDGGATWSPPANRNFVYYSNTGNWLQHQNAVTDLINGPFGGNMPERVQLQLGVTDLANLFAFPGNDATPSPAFDNAGFFKYRLQGPVWATRDIDLFMDSFPQTGAFSFHTLVDRQNAGCRVDMRDISSGVLNLPGDSTIVDVVSAIPGSPLTGPPELVWILDKNPKFDDVRTMPAGTTVIAGGALNGWDQWTGRVVGEQVTVNGVPVNNGNRFFGDLPDGNGLSNGGTTAGGTMCYPGDVLRWYWEASDTGGRTTTLPANTNGFATGRTANNGRYALQFTVHFLPTAVDDGLGGWTQPWILFVNDFGFRGGEDDYFQAFDQNGWQRGVHWDMYTTWGPSSSVSNGIGSNGAHGATSDQISGYPVIVYESGDLGTTLISDGTDTGNNDKGDDMSTLTGWFNQDDDRYIAHFGDDIVSALLTDSPGPGGTYVSTIMGASLGDNIVKDEINNQSAPKVVPAVGSPWFTTEYVAFGGCLGPNEFDSIDALVGSSRSHEFLTPGGAPYTGPNRAASVTKSGLDGNLNEKVSIAFPYGFVYVWDEAEPHNNGGVSARALLLREIIEDCFGHAVPNPGTPTGIGDEPQYTTFKAENLRFVPNPFNPKTTISFEIGQRQDVEVAIYNIRGEKVTTLHRGVMDMGVQSLTWNGVDGNGVPVSSGVYLVKGKALAEGKSFSQKITLIK